MLESKKLLGLSHQLVAFANDKKDSSQYPFFTAEAPTLDYLKRVQHRCTLLAKWQPSKDAPTSVTTAAKQWLKELADHGGVAAYQFVSLDVAFSLTSEGDIELIVARFPSLNVQFALTFAELTKPGRPLIRQCWCGQFFVREPGARGQPRKHCDEHYELMKSTKKKPPMTQGGKLK
jgi:hypothetical protein